jgi:hypothetical protein
VVKGTGQFPLGCKKKHKHTGHTPEFKKKLANFCPWRQKNYNATHVNDFCFKKNQI